MVYTVSMAYKPITVDRAHLTIMGVAFPDRKTLDSTANALGSNMFEGFEPTEKLIGLYRDYRLGKIKPSNLVALLRESL
jgi:putative transcriptional regulator